MERRRFARRVPAAEERLGRVRLRTGRELTVVDASSGGVLVEGAVRLLPGTHIDVHIVTANGRVLVRSRIARCCVAALDAHHVTYRGALAFERHVDVSVSGYGLPTAERGAAGVGERGYPKPTSVADAA